MRAKREDGSAFEFEAIARLDSAVDVDYYRNGGILQTVLRRLLRDQRAKQSGSRATHRRSAIADMVAVTLCCSHFVIPVATFNATKEG